MFAHSWLVTTLNPKGIIFFVAFLPQFLDPDRPLVRIMLFLLMLGGLVLAGAIPQAFESRALVFAVAIALLGAIESLA